MRTLDDTTPLNGDRIDVAARIGWTVRMGRITARNAGDTRLQSIAAQLGSSAAHLSRVETGQRRDSLITKRYEELLGVPDGALLAPISTLCRAFPESAPRDSGRLSGVSDVRTHSALTERLLDPTAEVAGGDWLVWARTLSVEGNIGLPASLFETITRRLASELGRSVLSARAPRHEALALLRRSHYGELVLDLTREAGAGKESHRLGALASVVGAARDQEAFKWAVQALSSEATARHGAMAVEVMGQNAPADFWDDLVTPLLRAFDTSAAGSEQERWSAHLVRLVPPTAWRRSGATPARALPPGPTVPDWSRTSENPLWTWCRQQSDEIAATWNLPSQPLLARLIFEIAFGPWEVRALYSDMLLSGLPELREPVATGVAAFVEQNPHSPVHPRTLTRLGGLLHGYRVDGYPHWLTSEDSELRNTALALAGGAGEQLDEELLLTALRDPATTRFAQYAAGMAAHPALAALAAHPDLDQETRTALAAWQASGGRITR